VISPLEEFEIHNYSAPLFSIGGHAITFTNSALYMLLAVFGSTLFMVMSMRQQALVPGRWQMMGETIYNMVANMVDGAAGEKAKPYFPFIFTIFVFVLFCNLIGMLPYTLGVTSHILINFAIALLLFTVIIFTGFARHGFHFLGLFVPHGAPKFMLLFLVPIELLSFAIRPFSLSIRLFANMMAGHILLGVFAGMTAMLVAAGWMASIGILPLLLNIAITGFEFFVAFLQAYIYAILASVYLRDAIEMH
jgi:F-type H+-transporting ATPase subunit a